MDSATWKQRIVEMVYIKNEIYKIDREQIFPYHFPQVAATEDEVATFEEALGEPLPPHYRAFLRHANGWRGFWQSADLFNTYQVVSSPEQRKAAELLNYLDNDGTLRDLGLRAEEFLPIAVKMENIDLFVIGRQSSSIPGIVIWFADEEIDRFPDFDEYFLAMIDYNRLVYQRLKDET